MATIVQRHKDRLGTIASSLTGSGLPSGQIPFGGSEGSMDVSPNLTFAGGVMYINGTITSTTASFTTLSSSTASFSSVTATTGSITTLTTSGLTVNGNAQVTGIVNTGSGNVQITDSAGKIIVSALNGGSTGQWLTTGVGGVVGWGAFPNIAAGWTDDGTYISSAAGRKVRINSAASGAETLVVGGTSVLAGATSITAGGTGLAVTNNATIGGTLSIGGSAAVGTNVTVAGSTGITGNITVGGTSIVTGTSIVLASQIVLGDSSLGNITCGSVQIGNQLNVNNGLGSEGQILTKSGGVPIWANPASASTQLVAKIVSSPKVSNPALVPDTHLQISLGANQAWLFEGTCMWSAGSGGIQCKVDYTGSYSTNSMVYIEIIRGASLVANDSNADSATTFSSATIFTSSSSATRGNIITFNGCVRTTSAGVFSFYWGQKTLNAAATTLYTGSFLKMTQISS